MKKERCVNCGRLIPVGLENQLCPKCSSCETIFDAQIVRLKKDLLDAAILSGILAVLATIFMFVFDFPRSDLAGTVLYIYAALSFGFSAANSFRYYLHLKETVKKEKLSQ